MECINSANLAEERINRILTQYRESPNLLAIIRHDLLEIADIYMTLEGTKGLQSDVLSNASYVVSDSYQVIISDPDCQPVNGVPEYFDINTAIGDQLTIVGKYLGFPRCHCVCQNVPFFGFNCETTAEYVLSGDRELLSDGDNVILTVKTGQTQRNVDIVGFCDGGGWFGCGEGGTADICFNDDEVYRSYLLARRYQARQLWDIDSLQSAAEYIWGPTARVHSMGGARVSVSPGRTLTNLEQIQLPVAFRVLPIAPGITPFISYDTGLVFGFGSGWGGLCEGSNWLCPIEFDAYSCD